MKYQVWDKMNLLEINEASETEINLMINEYKNKAYKLLYKSKRTDNVIYCCKKKDNKQINFYLLPLSHKAYSEIVNNSVDTIFAVSK